MSSCAGSESAKADCAKKSVVVIGNKKSRPQIRYWLALTLSLSPRERGCKSVAFVFLKPLLHLPPTSNFSAIILRRFIGIKAIALRTRVLLPPTLDHPRLDFGLDPIGQISMDGELQRFAGHLRTKPHLVNHP